jgi:hypothetical protein
MASESGLPGSAISRTIFSILSVLSIVFEGSANLAAEPAYQHLLMEARFSRRRGCDRSELRAASGAHFRSRLAQATPIRT